MTDQQVLVKALKLYSELEYIWTELRSGTESVPGGSINWVELLFTRPHSKLTYVVTGYSATPDEPDSEKLSLCGKLTDGDLEDVE